VADPGAQRDVRTVGLLGGFELRRDGRTVELGLSSQRLLAFLALHDRPLQRVHVAGRLWLDSSEERANANLRTTLWRLGGGLVQASSMQVALHPDVAVDVREAKALAQRVLGGRHDGAAEALCLAGELLPDWYDDWVVLDRERFRQLRLHALEALCDHLTAAGRFGEATEAAFAAVKSEPLRESAHRALIATHIAEGNWGEALRQYELFRDALNRSLGLEPSMRMVELMRRVAFV
jgi:DNA-binding SARP family transcriptional activator